jgi:hypothetical protein
MEEIFLSAPKMWRRNWINHTIGFIPTSLTYLCIITLCPFHPDSFLFKSSLAWGLKLVCSLFFICVWILYTNHLINFGLVCLWNADVCLCFGFVVFEYFTFVLTFSVYHPTFFFKVVVAPGYAKAHGTSPPMVCQPSVVPQY